MRSNCRLGWLTLTCNSTVSKILRQRDKYMHPQPKEESASPGKKSKAKLPDFEKTLTNWVKNQQKRGLPITDEDLRKQAQVFSFSRSDQAVVSSASWLDKFKRKNRLGATSKGDGNATPLDSSIASASRSPSGVSPLSSDGLVSPPMSAIDELGNDAVTKSEDTPDYFDFEKAKATFDQSPTLSQEFGDSLEHSSRNILSPISPELAADDQDGMAPLELPEDAVGLSSRQRSQTYPHLPSFGAGSRPSSSHQKAPALPMRSLTSGSESTPSAIDPRQMMKRHKSVPDIHYPEQPRFTSMQPPPLPRSADTSPVSNPSSPSEDDNIRALRTIQKLLEQNPNVAEPADYIAIGKLMEKLKLLRPATTMLPGGMHPIDIVDSPRMSKKRTYVGIST